MREIWQAREGWETPNIRSEATTSPFMAWLTIAEGVEGQNVAANLCDYLAQRLHVESRIP